MSTDRFDLMLLALAGTPPPPPPPIPGRQHRAPPADDSDPLAEAWDARTKPATPAELIDTEDTTD